jgi:hypothetical protein
LWPSSSGNTIHHTYHLAQFEATTGVDTEGMNCIIEFGGGYGNMCRIIHSMGFRGKYVIYDLPVLSELQRYYLCRTGVDVCDSRNADLLGSVAYVNTVDQLQQQLVGMARQDNNSLFISTWGLSETPLAVRDSLNRLISQRCRHVLLAYQNHFREIDNRRYFDAWQQSFGGMRWAEYPIGSMDGCHRYLFGSCADEVTR